jgi:2,3-bisphosphoglycerate-independent phosphoglycerate mutase
MTEKKVELKHSPYVVIIRDGWGYNPNPDEETFNAAKVANTPVDDMLMSSYPNCLIETSGEDVGLPDGTMGNSEVGHQNIGAGRVCYQDSVRITLSIRDGSFFENEVLKKAMQNAKDNDSALHLMGLCSDIGVHSLLEHLYGLLEMAKKYELEKVYLHAFTDGRDSPPSSGKGYLEDIQNKMKEIGTGRIVSIMGRFYAMDRDNRWQRVQQAYDCLVNGKGATAATTAEAMDKSYEKGETDEFVKPVMITDNPDEPAGRIKDGDSVVFFNYRGDRPREITRAFVDDNFEGFERDRKLDVYYVCMTEYDATINAPVAFGKQPPHKNIAGEYFSKLGLKQFRCAETEKYAHVTFFFNGGREEPFENEDRQIIPSPQVETYDHQPEMSAYEVTDTLLERLDSGKYDVIIMNYANPDMVGHTGVLEAAVKAAETVDECVGKLLDKVKKLGGSAVVLADHGNFECMKDTKNNLPHTAHTVGKVPFIIFDERYKNAKTRDGGRLADVMPTVLDLMEVEKPEEMTGQSLLVRE